MFRIKEKTDAKETGREEYLKRVFGETGFSSIVTSVDEQKKLFQEEAKRLGDLVAEVSSSTQVTGDCNKLLDEVGSLLRNENLDRYAIIRKFDLVKQRLIRAYDSRESLPWWFPFVIVYNSAILASMVAMIVAFGLVPGQKNLESTGFVLLACAIWGGLGGAVDVLFALITPFANQDFDKQNIPWYMFHPALGMSMGAVIFLILQAGLLAITGTTLQEGVGTNTTAISAGTSTTGRAESVALPIVLAFLVGFRQNAAVSFLTRTVNAVFQSASNTKNESNQ
jgi:hypothetical protein